jgi:signal transduction histidine kinase
MEGEILYANRRIGEYCEMSEYEIIGSRTKDVLLKLCEKTRSPSSCFNDILFAIDNNDITPPEFTLVHQDQDVYLRCLTFIVTDEAKNPIGYGLLMHDVTADRKLDKMKSNLMFTVSHELRTPLAAIKGYTSTLLADDIDWDKKSQVEFLTTISMETDRLTLLVKDLLDLNRIEAGSLHVKYQLCDLESMISQAAKSAHPAPGDKLKVHFIDEIPQFFADRRQIEVVLRNLIENASKYSLNASPIFVNAAIDGDCLLVSVKDNGPGIPPKHKSLIFDSFYRIDNSLSRKTSGSGLGLAISKGFIEAHEGKIWVEDTDIGANVSFKIPLNPNMAPDPHD